MVKSDNSDNKSTNRKTTRKYKPYSYTYGMRVIDDDTVARLDLFSKNEVTSGKYLDLHIPNFNRKREVPEWVGDNLTNYYNSYVPFKLYRDVGIEGLKWLIEDQFGYEVVIEIYRKYEPPAYDVIVTLKNKYFASEDLTKKIIL